MASFHTAKPVDCDVDFETSSLAGKTVIVTGGCSGLGEAYVRALTSVNSIFVKCDVSIWEDQVEGFRQAAAFSPSGRIDYVIANAGVASPEGVFAYDGDDHEPTRPDSRIIDINLNGALYTTKLAMHYFIKQNGTRQSSSQHDTCLILIGSGAAYLDVPRSAQYSASKWAIRGVMHAMRRMTHHYGGRVNMISPWYVRTKILSKEAFDQVQSVGVEFAEAEDACQCLLRLLSDRDINGRSLFVCPRKWAPRGYLDLDLDDYPGNDLLQEIQVDQIKNAPVELGLFPE
ncbi:hypothetical protein LTR56_015788 [Elasticomyces elasticus]|nr:hypothetical protein LTR56_015788 [Elasticomyces elasticus]KAK3662000.1 hypothetical protein LTR22_007171 [Elasticomyces elasticus]KAK4933167.1 hypothetical protein LTR49_000651 [Elasticomyces elasticus]KAK5755909.1 hypothetical protein LTS12_014026 [Elasticomyces elasticus]